MIKDALPIWIKSPPGLLANAKVLSANVQLQRKHLLAECRATFQRQEALWVAIPQPVTCFAWCASVCVCVWSWSWMFLWVCRCVSVHGDV